MKNKTFKQNTGSYAFAGKSGRTPMERRGFKNATGDYIALSDGRSAKQVAEEGWGFWTPGGVDIIYGTPGKNVVLKNVAPGDMKCSNDTFKSDPAPGEFKSCYEVQKQITQSTTGPASPVDPAVVNNRGAETSNAPTVNYMLWGGIAAALAISGVLIYKFTH